MRIRLQGIVISIVMAFVLKIIVSGSWQNGNNDKKESSELIQYSVKTVQN